MQHPILEISMQQSGSIFGNHPHSVYAQWQTALSLLENTWEINLLQVLCFDDLRERESQIMGPVKVIVWSLS